MIAREIAVRRFNKAISALKASVGETSLADALAHAQALVNLSVAKVQLVNELIVCSACRTEVSERCRTDE